MFFKRCENKCFNQHHLIWRIIQKQQAIRISTITASTQQSTGLDCAISDDSIQTNNICKNNTLDVMHQRNRRRIFRCAMYLFWGIYIYLTNSIASSFLMLSQLYRHWYTEASGTFDGPVKVKFDWKTNEQFSIKCVINTEKLIWELLIWMK